MALVTGVRRRSVQRTSVYGVLRISPLLLALSRSTHENPAFRPARASGEPTGTSSMLAPEHQAPPVPQLSRKCIAVTRLPRCLALRCSEVVTRCSVAPNRGASGPRGKRCKAFPDGNLLVGYPR